jgi:hypothetical protein
MIVSPCVERWLKENSPYQARYAPLSGLTSPWTKHGTWLDEGTKKGQKQLPQQLFLPW